MSDFFSNCLAAMATLLKKQKPIAFKMATVDKNLMVKMDEEGKDGGAEGDDGDYDVDNDGCYFVVDNYDDRVDVDNNDDDCNHVDSDDH